MIVLIKLKIKHKVPKLADVSMITGGVKTGKTTLGVHIAIKWYKKTLFKWKIKNYLCKLFKRKPPEKPLLYSNIPLKFEHAELTEDIILRRTRPRFKSVCLADEASLIADAMDWKDRDINEELKMFNKLWGHETHGGKLIYDTQAMPDVHYSIKRCLNNYLWIHHCIKWVPFLLIFKVREMMSMDGENTMNVQTEDAESGLMWMIVPKKVWRKFDCYCYSILTDNLPVQEKLANPKSLKTSKILRIGGRKK